MHKISSHEFGHQLLGVKKFKTIEYDFKDGKIRKCIDLIIESISEHTFMDDFKSNYLLKYVKHSQNAWCISSQFRLCRNTYPIGIILSMVDFSKNYTL